MPPYLLHPENRIALSKANGYTSSWNTALLDNINCISVTMFGYADFVKEKMQQKADHKENSAMGLLRKYFYLTKGFSYCSCISIKYSLITFRIDVSVHFSLTAILEVCYAIRKTGN